MKISGKKLKDSQNFNEAWIMMNIKDFGRRGYGV